MSFTIRLTVDVSPHTEVTILVHNDGVNGFGDPVAFVGAVEFPASIHIIDDDDEEAPGLCDQCGGEYNRAARLDENDDNPQGLCLPCRAARPKPAFPALDSDRVRKG